MWNRLIHPVYVVAELSMVVPLPPPQSTVHPFWVASALCRCHLACLVCLIYILNLLSLTNHPFDRLGAHGLILKHEVQVWKTWFIQVQRTHRTELTSLISGEEVSHVCSGERQQKGKSTWT